MGLFGKNYKKINEKNKQDIVRILDQMMTANADYLDMLNDMKNKLLAQGEADGKDIATLDAEILGSLETASSLLSTGSIRQAETYLNNAKAKISSRVMTVSGVNKKINAPKLSPEMLIDIMLAKSQDKVTSAAKEYNELKAKAQAGDMVSQSKLNLVYQQYQIANQEFTAISNNVNREAAAKMMQTFTEEQMERIANRKISDEELSVIVDKYSQVSSTIAKEGQDVLNINNVIGGVAGVINATQNEINMGLNAQAGFGANMGAGMPDSLSVPGSGIASTNGFSAGANPFMNNADNEFSTISDNSLYGSKNMLNNQIDTAKELLEDKKAERVALDKKMKNLLIKHSSLSPAEAKALEPEIDSLSIEIENNDFELNNIRQEVLQLQENLGIVVKLLSVKSRQQREQMLKQKYGGNFDVEKFAMMIANAQDKFNQNLQKVDDANVVSRAQNTTTTRSTVDFGASFDSPEKKNYDDLKKSFGINN